MIKLMAYDELDNEVCVCRVQILEMDNLTREEKTEYANFLVEKKKEQYQEYKYFHFEKDFSYFDEEGCFDYFLSIAEDEEGLDGDEAMEYAQKLTDEAYKEHFDIGFDY